MESQISPSDIPATKEVAVKSSGKRTASKVFSLIGLVLTLYGLYTALSLSDKAHVGGYPDGYGYSLIIDAGRGTAFVCAGIVSVLASVVLAILDLADRQR